MNPKRGNLPNIGWHLLAWMLVITTGISHAALPPQFQNEKDLDVIMDYIKANTEVLSGLQAIDLGSMSVYYGDGCSARFARQYVDRPAGWTGPAAPLEFIEASCPEATDMLSEADDIGGITERETSACDLEKKEEACEIAAPIDPI